LSQKIWTADFATWEDLGETIHKTLHVPNGYVRGKTLMITACLEYDHTVALGAVKVVVKTNAGHSHVMLAQ
jgi:hypothetical protein